MIYSGCDAIKYLASQAEHDEAGKSSHWEKYHEGYQFDGSQFKGLKGFGGNAKPYKGLKLGLNSLLQQRFRKLGAVFGLFEQISCKGKLLTERQCRAMDLDVLRQSITLSFLYNHLPEVLSPEATSCVIGDGFATLTSLFLGSDLANQVLLVNLTKTLLVDLWYLKSDFGDKEFDRSVCLVTDEAGIIEAIDKKNESARRPRVIAIQADNHALLRFCPIDIAVNVASMQEMEPKVIEDYFMDFRAVATRKPIAFYCCNREEKELPDGTITRYSEYPWRKEDKVLVDELCPWHQQYYTLYPPFYRPYDGPHRHRLLYLSS